MLFTQIPRRRALSTLELLLTIAMISLLAVVSAIAVSKVNQNTQAQKLNSDVVTMNSAIQLYRANGGDLDGITVPNELLTKLKTSRSSANRATHAGAPSGRMIDNRVTTADVAADSWKARALYNATTERFEVVEDVAGVEFILDDDLAETMTVTEARDPGAVNYASTSTWVWDHTSTSNPSAPSGPSTFSTTPVPADSNPNDPVDPPDPPTPPGGGGGGPVDPPPPPPIPYLAWPDVQPPGGAHPEDDFPLSVIITNPPPATDGDAFYQIDSGAWTPYAGAITIEMNEALRVQFRTKDNTRFQDGWTRYDFYYPVPEALSGSADGDFHSPHGGPNLQYEITNNADTFTHGDPVYILDGEPIESGDPNVLEFTGQNFTNVAPGEKFKIGEFFYRNGNSYYDSHASRVDLRVTVNLPEHSETFDFNLRLDLVNTPNDPDDPTASADYVTITNLQQNINLWINGVRYRMNLEFGATDSFGFSTADSFHVYEGASGRGDLLATFIAN